MHCLRNLTRISDLTKITEFDIYPHRPSSLSPCSTIVRAVAMTVLCSYARENLKRSVCYILLLKIMQFVREKFCLQVTFVVKAVSAFSAAVFLMQAEQCQGRNLSECSRISNINLQQEILSTLSRLSFTSQQKAPFELQGTSIHVTHDGQLISNKYVIFHIRDTGDVSGVSSNYMYWDILLFSLLMRTPLTLIF